MALFPNFREDVKRHFRPGQKPGFWKILFKIVSIEGIWAVSIYRFLSWYHRRCPMAIKWLIFPGFVFFYYFSRLFLDVHISHKAKIGKGLFLEHTAAIYVGPIEMGEYCNINQEVTIGQGPPPEQDSIATFGDRVWIGAGAKIFGNACVGNDVVIGPLTLVTKDVPDGATILGNPPRIFQNLPSGDRISGINDGLAHRPDYPPKE